MKSLKGLKFARLTIIEQCGVNKWRNSLWNCKCECGNEITVSGGNLTKGNTKSCGCLQVEKRLTNRLTHGMTDTRFYNIFSLILSRCNNKKSHAFKNYGKRGIKCGWNSFEEFKSDMYSSYVEHVKKYGVKNTQIDRKDNNGSYTKINCRWATLLQQGRNKRNNVLIKFNGKSFCMSEWEQILGLRKGLVWQRLNQNWSIEKALTT